MDKFFVRRYGADPSDKSKAVLNGLDGADLDHPGHRSELVRLLGLQDGEDHLRHLVPGRSQRLLVGEAAIDQAVVHLRDRGESVRIVLEMDEGALQKHLPGGLITPSGDGAMRG